MLNDTTKRNIQNARDVLVGKVPDPKAQVEQITTALIYKFMHDLDQQSVKLGGQPGFFTGDYAQFAWPNLLDTRLTGEKRLDLYVRAITGMERNPGLPQLFRDIFKGAFLPYNDPQTLSLFLKEIDKFAYTHSEELGNAYEMLLSIMSSQGDAGQFRTPRHIIDFMVAVVDPKKNETILDPACGTAGFLISSFKHIRKHNSSAYQPEKNHLLPDAATAVEAFLRDDPAFNGDRLTPEEKKRLMENIQGYDISPDMVRLSLVNLYLHGFQLPRIFEYDTLTSEDRWDESFDVILANPPFMSPRGGIRPHKRFQVQATRSEVLFVDYILEHLNINGRAGIIVPEGVIFRNENSYKQLRKLLVEDGLYCVVSLPSGVFNPYSGVKTSILFFDKALAKKQEEILFIKIENDGFDLGAQRRKIDLSDLPEALRIINSFQLGEKSGSEKAIIVNKNEIQINEEASISGERYRVLEIVNSRRWDYVDLEKVINDIKSGFAYGKSDMNGKGVPHIRPMNINNSGQLIWKGTKFIPEDIFLEKSEFQIKEQDILFNNTNSKELVGKTCIFKEKTVACFSNHITRIRVNNRIINPYFLSIILHSYWKSGLFNSICNKWVGQAGINNKALLSIKIPLPPLEVQHDIVEQIEVKQAAIDAARAVIAALEKERRFFGRELQGRDDVEWVELGEVFEKVTDNVDPQQENGLVDYIGLENIISNNGRLEGSTKVEIRSIKSTKTRFKPNDILFGKLRPNLNKVWVSDRDGICSTDIYVLHPKKEKLNPHLYALFFRSDFFVNQVLQGISGAQLPRVNFDYLKKLEVPVFQEEIVESLITDQVSKSIIISHSNKLISTLEEKINLILENLQSLN